MNKRAYVLLLGLLVCQTCSGFLERFTQDSNPCVCPVCDVSEDDKILATFHYKKLTAWLFKRSSLEENEETGQFQRVVLFSITTAQLEVIENHTDLRDLDAVITTILGAAKTSEAKCETTANKHNNILELVGDILKDCFEISKLVFNDTETRFGFFVVASVLLIWVIHKRYNKNIIIVTIVMFFLYGYFLTYLECNRQLDAESVISFIKESTPESDGLLSKAYNSILKPTKQDKQIEYIQKNAKVKLPFCRPDRVLMMYVNDMFLHQLQLIVEKYVDIIAQFNNKLNWFYGSIAVAVFPVLLFLCMKLAFEHVFSPVAWFRAWRETHGHSSNQNQQRAEHLTGDRISGPNLQALLEIMANLKSKEKNTASSGVEQINDAIEGANTAEDSDKSCGESSVKSKNVDKIENIEEES